MRDLFRRDQDTASLRGELYPEMRSSGGLALSLFLGWEADRLQADEIWLAVVVTIAGAFLSRMLAIVYGVKAGRTRKVSG